MKKIILVKSENTEINKSILQFFTSKGIEIEEKEFEQIESTQNSALIVLTSFEKEYDLSKIIATTLNLHPSLLPSFKGKNALAQVYASDIKVSGITIHYANKDLYYGKILAQYPILIGLETNYEELRKESIEISKTLYPAVINAVLSDKVFDFADLFKSNHTCSGNCGHCSH